MEKRHHITLYHKTGKKEKCLEGIVSSIIFNMKLFEVVIEMFVIIYNIRIIYYIQYIHNIIYNIIYIYYIRNIILYIIFIIYTYTITQWYVSFKRK